MSDLAAWLLLLGRILFVAMFVNSAVGHLTKGETMKGYAGHMGLPAPALAAWPSGVWLLAGSLSIVLGAWADVGALMLAVFVVLAAAWFHRFWQVDDADQRDAQKLNFFRNATLLGAALVLFALFTTVGHDLALTLTDPLIDLRP